VPRKKTSRDDGPSVAVCMRVMKRDRFRCTYCGVPGTDAELQVDHIIAVANGGSHHMANLTTACRKCNQSKGTKDGTPTRNGSLVGRIIHTHTESGDLEYRGEIVAEDGGVFLVQIYSAWTGEPTEIRPMAKSYVYSDRVKIYATQEASNDAATKWWRRREKEGWSKWEAVV
jgi:hypothetical protein